MASVASTRATTGYHGYQFNLTGGSTMIDMKIIATGMPESVEKYEEALNAAFAGGIAYGKFVTDEMIVRAAKALAKDCAKDAGTHATDEWKFYSESYITMATVALNAAYKDAA